MDFLDAFTLISIFSIYTFSWLVTPTFTFPFCCCLWTPTQRLCSGPWDVIYFLKAMTNSFQISISKVYFSIFNFFVVAKCTWLTHILSFYFNPSLILSPSMQNYWRLWSRNANKKSNLSGNQAPLLRVSLTGEIGSIRITHNYCQSKQGKIGEQNKIKNILPNIMWQELYDFQMCI